MITGIYQKWINLSALKFVLITTILIIILNVVIKAVFLLFGISDNAIGGLNSDKYGILYLSFIVLIVGPMLETLISQQIPILISQRFLKINPTLSAITLSALVFSLGHFGYSVWYAIEVIPAGIILATTFIVFQKRKESSFWITSVVHSSINLIILIVVSFEKYIL